MKRKPKIASTEKYEDPAKGGEERQLILDSANTAGDVYLVQGIMPEGSEVPPHIHSLEDEIFHVLEGEVKLILGEDTIHGKPGDVIYLPRGIKHGIKTHGKQTARVLNYVIPGKNFEAFFHKLHVAGEQPSPEIRKQIAGEHGITFL